MVSISGFPVTLTLTFLLVRPLLRDTPQGFVCVCPLSKIVGLEL